MTDAKDPHDTPAEAGPTIELDTSEFEDATALRFIDADFAFTDPRARVPANELRR